MGKLKTAIKLLINEPEKIRVALSDNFARTKISHLVPDKMFLKMRYKVLVGKKLDLKEPKSFNEKLQWLKLYDRNPEYVRMVDKCEVKKYVSDIIGEEYVIPTLAVWDNVDDIDIGMLPSQFVLKCTHDSGSIIICKDKDNFDLDSAKKRLKQKLKQNMFWWGREWPYKPLKPRIIAEQYMEDKSTAELRDYKFFCFEGEVKCFKIDYDRFKDHKANYYTPTCDLLKFGEEVCPPDFDRQIPPPNSLKKMLEFAKKLACGHHFLRVDFYEVNDQIYFGELTFFPASGFGPFIPQEWDITLGSWISLPTKK